MKNTTRNIICATALCALCASFVPRAVGADAAEADAEAKKEEQLKLTQYIKLAKMVFTAGSEDDTKAAIKSAIKETVDKADGAEARAQALSEIVASLSAALTAYEDEVYASELYKTVLETAAELGGSDAAKLDSAKLAAATSVSVTKYAGYTSKGDEAVADNLKSEVKLATNDPKSVLSDKSAWALRELYEKVLAALRGSKYQIKLDIDEMLLDPLGEDRGTTTTTLGGSGDYVGKTHYPTTTTKPSSPSKPKQPKKPVPPTTKPSPTPTGRR